jgi:benzoyl-CoA reductase subunit BamC
MCESDPPLDEPMCVQWCLNDALIYEVREEEVEEQASPDKLETGLESLANEYGLGRIVDVIARMAHKN